MKSSFRLLLVFLLITSSLIVQPKWAGAQSTTVTSSSEHMLGGKTAAASNTLDDIGLISPEVQASRFLTQATVGPTRDEIDSLAMTLDYEAWIDSQMALPHLSYDSSLIQTRDDIINYYNSVAGTSFPPNTNLREWMLQPMWWNRIEYQEDQLRHRVVMALSEIFVISQRSDLQGYPTAFTTYYNLLSEHCFGSYDSLLLDVTLSPAMGNYLSHYGNPNSDPLRNPDENYAREIMQLFSIGLDSLNMDGTAVLDPVTDERIPTYDNIDIQGLSKVFTGLSSAGLDPCPLLTYEDFVNKKTGDYTQEMKMYDCFHEPGDKTFLNLTINGSIDDLQEIKDAVAHIANHPNVGPFISLRLIQQLVSSNPTPSYVSDITAVFNDDGTGMRGNLGAVIKAILLHPEARTCEPTNLGSTRGKLREPLLRMYHLARAMDKIDTLGYFYERELRLLEASDQSITSSPTVFNYYSPLHVPNIDFENANLFGPEFQLHNYRTAIAFPNLLLDVLYDGPLAQTGSLGILPPINVDIDWTKWVDLANDQEDLMTELEVVFGRGLMTQDVQDIIRDAISSIDETTFGPDYTLERARMALWLTLISADNSVIK